MKKNDSGPRHGDCRNERIISPLKQKYDGRYQFVFTGEIDDYFLLRNSFGRDAAFFNLKNALVQYALVSNYDLIIVLNEHLKITFPSEDMCQLFSKLTADSSKQIVDGGMTTQTFVPKTGDANATAGQKRNTSAQNAADRAQKEAGTNQLDQITNVMRNRDLRVFVIFNSPEKMGKDIFSRGLEIVSVDWRNLVGRANSDTRSALIVNPTQFDNFISLCNRASPFVHMIQEIHIQQAAEDEYMAFLRESYLRKNHLAWNNGILSQVVRSGMSKGSLFNFIEWIQTFFHDGTKSHIAEILLNENIQIVEPIEVLQKKLNSMIGLAEVKRAVNNIVALAQKDKDAFLSGNYTMVFLGNPGTGKTEVARLVGKMFYSMGLRRKPSVTTLKLQDIQSGYNEGDVIVNMREKIKEAMGGVLFVDEVYQFAESTWGKSAFENLLTEIENNRADLTVILAGYEEKFSEILKINPGFASRMPERFRIHFADYTPEEKLAIFKFFMRNKNANMRLQQDAEHKLMRILGRKSGNARGVRNVFEEVMANLNGAYEITAQMVMDHNEINPDAVTKFIEKLNARFIGMEPLKAQLRKYLVTIQGKMRHEKLRGLTRDTTGKAPRMRFVGPPGTGKTTAAELMAEAFKALGVIDVGRCYSAPANTLKGTHIGDAQNNVAELFNTHRGECIFLDEAYGLWDPQQNDSYGNEVITTLLHYTEKEENRRTAIILAGYKDEIDQLMTANSGFLSRFPDEIMFPSYNADECCEIFFKSAIDEEGWIIDDRDAFHEELQRHFEERCLSPDFANAREVKNLLQEVISTMFLRTADLPLSNEDEHIQVADLQAVLAQSKENKPR